MYILLVEDELRLAQVVRKVLEEEGHTVDVAHDGEEGLAMAMDGSHDVVVLDVLLPGMDGFEVCRSLRANRVDVPVLLLTALDGVEDRVRGLDSGADDYLPKPFRIEELLARLRSIVRRSAGHASSVVSSGDIVLDERQMKVSVRGVPITLSPLEYRLVAYLLRHRGRVVSQHELDENVYGHGEDHDSNALEVLIGRVRKKLGPDLIETRRGFGYIVPETPA